MQNILDEIVKHKLLEVKASKRSVSEEHLRGEALFHRTPLSFIAALEQKTYGVIAEFKRQSPSKGIINSTADPAQVVSGYVRAGVAGVSILTDNRFFGGTPQDLRAVRTTCPRVPILRKDFILDSYQIDEAKAWGADMILLIASILSRQQLEALNHYAHSLDMQVLCEVHSEEELLLVPESVDIVGINNRNLKTFTTEVETSVRLSQKLPSSMPRISESGLDSPEIVRKLKRYGFNGFLIGENFMKDAHPGEAAEVFMKELQRE